MVVYINSKLFLILGNIVCWLLGAVVFVITVIVIRTIYVKWDKRTTKSILYDMYNKHKIQSKINKISKDIKK